MRPSFHIPKHKIKSIAPEKFLQALPLQSRLMLDPVLNYVRPKVKSSTPSANTLRRCPTNAIAP